MTVPDSNIETESLGCVFKAVGISMKKMVEKLLTNLVRYLVQALRTKDPNLMDRQQNQKPKPNLLVFPDVMMTFCAGAV